MLISMEKPLASERTGKVPYGVIQTLVSGEVYGQPEMLPMFCARLDLSDKKRRKLTPFSISDFL